MNSSTLLEAAWAAFDSESWNSAFELFTNAETLYGSGLFEYNLSICREKLLADTKIPAITDIFPYSPITAYDNKLAGDVIAVGIASMPSRIDTLEKVLKKIYNQVDEIYLYLNNFDRIPDFTLKSKIKIFRSDEFGDLRDNGKFFGLQYVDSKAYYFTLDDDLDYPIGYFSHLVKTIKKYSNAAVVGLHGTTYSAKPRSFFDRLTYNFERELAFDVPVSVLGTGTVGFYVGTVNSCLQYFTQTGMADLVFANYLKSIRVPSICVARPKEWLTEYSRADRSDTIYHETKNDTSKHDKYLIENGPWGIENILDLTVEVNSYLVTESKEYLEFLSKVETSRNKGPISELDTSTFRYLFGVNGLYSLSDAYYAEIIASLASNNNAESPSLVDDFLNDAFSITLANFGLTHYERTGIYNANSAINVFVENYLILTDSAELKTLYRIYNLKRDSHRNSNDITSLVSELCELGDTAPIYKHFSILKTIISEDLLVKIYKTSILDNSDFRHEIEKSINSIKTVNAVMLMVKILRLILDDDPKVDESIEILVNMNFSGKKKRRYLDEIYNFCNLKGYRSDFSKVKLLLQNAKLDNSISLILSQLIVNQESATTQIIFNKVYKVVSNNYLEGERDLWTAELNYQIDGEVQHVVNGINKVFTLSGLATLDNITSNNTNFFEVIRMSGSSLPIVPSFGKCTVIIAAYEAHNTLQYAYDSVCEQTYRDLEVFIIDDCSSIPVTDYLNVSASVPTYILRNEANQGPYGCRNEALNKATGEFFMIHDADDWIHPSKVAEQIKTIHDTELVCSYTRHLRVSSKGHLKLENHGEFIGHGPMTSLFKMSVFREIGIFDKVPTRGDMEFKARIKKVYGEHRIYEDNRLMLLSLDWHSNSKKKTESIKKKRLLSNYKKRYTHLQALTPFSKHL
ncbi:glycosyltransferase family A protein [Paraglaciecola chathamensis]|uniref:glycosyltransferase family A protein n=1 Tax=Paraglaciecola chathamensis TaxID=368405 RepID=UPI00270F2EAF|nr:glycosyltransferase family A protein [Paraglaciecola chathamensis]MDO6838035.1 glycosyltransferase family A protein [Paraglaciecola chathamensis]